MWITNKKVELTSNSLVVVAVAAKDDLMDYHVATFDVSGEESGFFVLWDDIGTILNIDEIEAYMPFDEFSSQQQTLINEKERKPASYLKNGTWTTCEDYVFNSWVDGDDFECAASKCGYVLERNMLDIGHSMIEIFRSENALMPDFFVTYCICSAVEHIYIHGVPDLILFFEKIKPMVDLVLMDQKMEDCCV